MKNQMQNIQNSYNNFQLVKKHGGSFGILGEKMEQTLRGSRGKTKGNQEALRSQEIQDGPKNEETFLDFLLFNNFEIMSGISGK